MLPLTPAAGFQRKHQKEAATSQEEVPAAVLTWVTKTIKISIYIKKRRGKSPRTYVILLVLIRKDPVFTYVPKVGWMVLQSLF